MVLVLIAILSLLPAQPIQVPTLLSLNDAPLLLTTAVNPNYHSERCGIFLTNLKSTSQLQVSIIIYIYIHTISTVIAFLILSGSAILFGQGL